MTEEVTEQKALWRAGKITLAENVVESLVPEVKALIQQFLEEGQIQSTIVERGVRTISLEHPQFALVESGKEPAYAVWITRLRDIYGNPLYQLSVCRSQIGAWAPKRA